jgi:hypothetical protein
MRGMTLLFFNILPLPCHARANERPPHPSTIGRSMVTHEQLHQAFDPGTRPVERGSPRTSHPENCIYPVAVLGLSTAFSNRNEPVLGG